MLTYCPSCRNQLRVQDEFLGRQVRCPTCNAVFEATVGAPPPAPSDQFVDYDPHADPRQYAPERPSRHYDDEYDRSRRRRGEKPGKVQAIAIMTLIGGIFALMIALTWLGVDIGSVGVCCLWPGQYYSIVLGIMAIIKGSQLLGRDDWKQAPPSTIAVMQIINVINGDVTNCVLGIITLVFLNEPEVKRYYRG
jgi:predicted Zn finger-like uncharacterized protein